MNAIQIMNNEHKYITRMLKVARIMSKNILNGKEIDYDDFDLVIEFIKNYADNHHHKKEEDLLFNRMIENLGEVAEKVVKHGMIVEHDFGRLYVSDLKIALEKVKNGDDEAKLDVIASLISYTHLLERHITKEDNVIYTFAQRELTKEVMDLVDKECIEFEEKNSTIRDKYIKILEQLELKYL